MKTCEECGFRCQTEAVMILHWAADHEPAILIAMRYLARKQRRENKSRPPEIRTTDRPQDAAEITDRPQEITDQK